METFLLILVTVLLVGALVLIFLLYKKMENVGKPKEGEENLFVMLQSQIQDLNKTVDQKMSENTNTVFNSLQKQHGDNQVLIKNITEDLNNVKNTNQQVLEYSEKLSNLEKILKHQKQRGNLGELGLKMILENAVPLESYKLQYQFDDKDVVDAVILTKDGMIPVDAKFSLDNYERLQNEDDEDKKKELQKKFKEDLKKRIEETSKYIKPQYGTLDFAFMFIPAEAIYYDLLIGEVGSVDTKNLIEFAYKQKKVIIVSPTTFIAYLKTVIMGLNSLKIEKSVQIMIKKAEKLDTDLKSYYESLYKVGKSLGTTVTHWEAAHKRFVIIDKDITKITGGEPSVIPELLDKPVLDKNE